MLNPEMLDECKEVIFKDCSLPESVKEPVHIAIKTMMTLENAYTDFLSREIAGEGVRINPLAALITAHGGDDKPFIDWFMNYEIPAEGKSASPAWGG